MSDDPRFCRVHVHVHLRAVQDDVCGKHSVTCPTCKQLTGECEGHMTWSECPQCHKTVCYECEVGHSCIQCERCGENATHTRNSWDETDTDRGTERREYTENVCDECDPPSDILDAFRFVTKGYSQGTERRETLKTEEPA